MKKSLLAIGFSVVLFSCKKDKTTDFTATDMTGNATLSGKITKTIVAQNSGSGYSTVVVPAQGVEVSVRILNSQLYPNSPSAQGSMVYNATTDANGNYNITVKANSGGSTGTITVNDFVGTRDTIIGSTVKPGPYNNFGGTTATKTFVRGQDQTFTYSMVGTALVTNPNQTPNIGTAIVTGSLFITYIKQTGPTTYVPSSYILPNYPVTLKMDKDPTTQQIRTYTGMTDANGIYSFTVQTTDIGTPGFTNQNATVQVPDYSATQDTIKTGNVRVTGRMGVFGNTSNNVTGVTSTEIKNQINMSYNSFIPN